MREGRDFASREELLEQAGESAMTVRRGEGEKLAEAALDEVRWLRVTGELPGGLPWDLQPAWRVRLWALLMDEEQRAAVAAEIMRME